MRASRFSFLDTEHDMDPQIFKSYTLPFPAHRTARQRNRTSQAVRRWLGTAFRRWQRRKLIEALRRMDDRMLRDIGIDRSDLSRVVDGFMDRKPRMRPVSSHVDVDAA